MKLKNILLEERLSSILSDFKISIPPDKLLYRGSTVKLGDWKVRNIRKDREPRDTHEYLQTLIDLFAEKMYPKAPKRSESKFAANSTGEARKYAGAEGSVKVVFPEKGANIVSFETDTLRMFFGSIEQYFNQIDRGLSLQGVSIKDNPIGKNEKHYYKFLELAKKIFDRNTHKMNEFVELVKNHGEEIKDYAKRERIKYGKLGEEVLGLIGTIEAYFNEMERGVTGESDEIMFDGDQYLAIEKEYFDENFEWNGTRWELK